MPSMPINKKTLIALLIFVSGVSASFFILAKKTTTVSKNDLVVLKTNPAQTGSQFDFQRAALIDNLPPETLNNPLKETEQSQNFTENLAQAYAQKTLQENNINTKTAEKITQQVFDNNNFKEIIYPQLTEKDIKISDDNSLNAQIKYLRDFSAIGQKNFKSFNTPITTIIEQLIVSENQAPMKEYLAIAQAQIKDLAQIATPSLWKTFHLQNLNLWQKKIAVYNALLNKTEDPLKAIIAFQIINSLRIENENLQTILKNTNNDLKSL